MSVREPLLSTGIAPELGKPQSTPGQVKGPALNVPGFSPGEQRAITAGRKYEYVYVVLNVKGEVIRDGFKKGWFDKLISKSPQAEGGVKVLWGDAAVKALLIHRESDLARLAEKYSEISGGKITEGFGKLYADLSKAEQAILSQHKVVANAVAARAIFGEQDADGDAKFKKMAEGLLNNIDRAQDRLERQRGLYSAVQDNIDHLDEATPAGCHALMAFLEKNRNDIDPEYFKTIAGKVVDKVCDLAKNPGDITTNIKLCNTALQFLRRNSPSYSDKRDAVSAQLNALLKSFGDHLKDKKLGEQLGSYSTLLRTLGRNGTSPENLQVIHDAVKGILHEGMDNAISSGDVAKMKEVYSAFQKNSDLLGQLKIDKGPYAEKINKIRENICAPVQAALFSRQGELARDLTDKHTQAAQLEAELAETPKAVEALGRLVGEALPAAVSPQSLADQQATLVELQKKEAALKAQVDKHVQVMVAREESRGKLGLSSDSDIEARLEPRLHLEFQGRIEQWADGFRAAHKKKIEILSSIFRSDPAGLQDITKGIGGDIAALDAFKNYTPEELNREMPNLPALFARLLDNLEKRVTPQSGLTPQELAECYKELGKYLPPPDSKEAAARAPSPPRRGGGVIQAVTEKIDGIMGPTLVQHAENNRAMKGVFKQQFEKAIEARKQPQMYKANRANLQQITKDLALTRDLQQQNLEKLGKDYELRASKLPLTPNDRMMLDVTSTIIQLRNVQRQIVGQTITIREGEKEQKRLEEAREGNHRKLAELRERENAATNELAGVKASIARLEAEQKDIAGKLEGIQAVVADDNIPYDELERRLVV